MKLTEKEKQLISGALLAQMTNISESIKSIAHTGDKSLTDLLTEHRKELAALNSKICEAMREDESESGEATQMKIRDMFTASFYEKYGDVDIYNDVTDDMASAFCGMELTAEGREHFKIVLGVPVEIVSNRYGHDVICKIDDMGDAWEMDWREIAKLFDAAAGYCGVDDYETWFKEIK